MFSGKAVLRLCFVFAFVVCALPSKSPGAEAPANDLVENARVIPAAVATTTNLTNFGATVSAGEPDTNGAFASLWFRHAPMSLSSTGRVTLAGGSSFTRSLRVYELTDTGLVRRAMNASSVMLTNRPGKTNYIAIYALVPGSNSYTLSYSFPTLQLARPTHAANFSTGAPIEIEAVNPELDADIESLTVRARNAELGWVNALTGNGFPFVGQWSTTAAGYIDIFVEARTVSGDLRRSATNQVTALAANDRFANAVELAPGGGEYLFRPFLLTREAGEPTVSMAPSMWFRWVPERSGVARMAAGPTQQLVLYRGESLGSLTQVANSPAVPGVDGFQAEVTGGQTYYLAAYAADAVARRLTYSVAPIRFTSPTVRTGLKAPVAIDLAVSGVPGDVEAVDYFRNGTLIGTATTAPFALRWENVFTGPMVITAVGRAAQGATYASEAIGLQASAVNDNFADATVLPPEFLRADLHASGYMAAHGEFETGAGLWWRWTPASAGLCNIVPVEQGVGILVLSEGARVAEAYNRRVTFATQAGKTYSILITHSVAPENGFHVSIHHSPLTLAAGTGAQGQPVELRPVITGPVGRIARVDYYVGQALVASGSGPGFAGIWVPAQIGTFDVAARVVLADGVEVDAGFAPFAIGPSNDRFANALELRGDVTFHEISIDPSLATTEPGDPANSTKTVWWKWTPVFSGRTRVQLETTASK